MSIFSRKTIHLDYASTTPLDSGVFKKMQPFLSDQFYNPSALYDDARKVKVTIEQARKDVARYLSCRSEEVVFTSGGTESSNIAIKGILQAIWTQNPQLVPHVIATKFEHPATLSVCEYLESKGWISLTLLKPNEHGVITPETLSEAITPETRLVTCIHVHNETGIIQPVRSLSRVIQKYKKEQDVKGVYPVFHVDASQSPSYIHVQKESLGADLITLDSSKFYGPKGVGVLFVKSAVPIEGVYHGGGQEKGLRPGTENTAGIIGFADALMQAEQLRESEMRRLQKLHDFFTKNLLKNIPGVMIHGKDQEKTPHIVNACFPTVDSEFLTIQLASHKINVSFMTACKTSGEESESQSIKSFNPDCAGSSIRFSFGRKTSQKELRKTIEVLKKLVR